MSEKLTQKNFIKAVENLPKPRKYKPLIIMTPYFAEQYYKALLKIKKANCKLDQ